MSVLEALRGLLLIAACVGVLVGVLTLPMQRYRKTRGIPSRANGVLLLVTFLPLLASSAMELVCMPIVSGRVPIPGRRTRGYYALESSAGQISLTVYAVCISFTVAALIWAAWRRWKRGAIPPQYTQKPGIGGLLARLSLSGKTLNPVQDWALELLQSALPVHIKGLVDRQFGSFDDVRLEADGSLLIFVRRSRDPSPSPRLPMTAAEAPLARLTATVLGDSEPLQATLTAVHGQVFSLRFNRATAWLPLSQLRLTGVVSAYPPSMPTSHPSGAAPA